jgi:hypothetical protein
MDKKIVGLADAMTSLASMQAADAAMVQNETEIMNPRSYSELLQSIPNAVALLKAVDRANATRAEAETQTESKRKTGAILLLPSSPSPFVLSLLLSIPFLRMERRRVNHRGPAIIVAADQRFADRDLILAGRGAGVWIGG